MCNNQYKTLTWHLYLTLYSRTKQWNRFYFYMSNSAGGFFSEKDPKSLTYQTYPDLNKWLIWAISQFRKLKVVWYTIDKDKFINAKLLLPVKLFDKNVYFISFSVSDWNCSKIDKLFRLQLQVCTCVFRIKLWRWICLHLQI